jgi:hypothetical protein
MIPTASAVIVPNPIAPLVGPCPEKANPAATPAAIPIHVAGVVASFFINHFVGQELPEVGMVKGYRKGGEQFKVFKHGNVPNRVNPEG